MLRKWQIEYGAELVAHYGTILHFDVSRPPQNHVKSFELAKEQEALAPCTTAQSGATLSDLSIALINRDNWFIHQRP